MAGMAGDLNEKRYVIHPAKFTLWLFMVSIILFFGGLTSAYIVSKGIESDRGAWHFFTMPKVLWLTSLVLLVSSVMLQVGVAGARRGDFRRTRIGFGLTGLLGAIFLIGQVIAWRVMTEEGVLFGGGGTNAGNYLYVLTAVHGLHIVAGLAFLAYIYIGLLGNRYQPGKIVAIENCATFWHFLGLLWIYLFIFLLMNQGDPLV
jgi:cytochrome c oxidase subunit III